MSELKFDKATVYKLNWFGTSYEIKKPNVILSLEYQKKIESLSGNIEKVEAMIDFLHGLGLPKDITYQMDFDQLDQVIQTVMPVDKKK
jgi:hypothetical protein